MIIIAYLWILSLFLMTGFTVTAVIIEKNFDESHPVKKWWRKHIIDTDPEQYKYPEDDIQE
jgi:hypothetical protein